MRWQVGVLRAGAENIDWTDHVDRDGWQSARDEAVEAWAPARRARGAEEYRVVVGDQEAYCWPGVTETGVLDLSSVHDIMLRHPRTSRSS